MASVMIEKPSVAKQEEKAIRGKTPSGEVFIVPKTEDMVRTLFDPSVKKSIFDIVILSVLVSFVILYWFLSPNWRTPVFIVLYFFWRLSYNVGIGYLLQGQSKRNMMVKWAAKLNLFNEKNHSALEKFIKLELTSKMKGVEHYDYYKVPIEFNTWLLFRHFVDLVLMSDFVTYMLIVFSKFGATENEPWYIFCGRWVAGIFLFFFNLFVKLDAHRVIKDYAWYWGDFFFLEDVQLTFDGVFEMAPHPMYSIGYAGYYGFALMASSYTVLIVSILAHIMQFAFLVFVENPHIDKTYSPPRQPSVRRKSSAAAKGRSSIPAPLDSSRLETPSSQSAASSMYSAIDDDYETESRITHPALIVFKNFRYVRVTDLACAALCAVFAVCLITSSNGKFACGVLFMFAVATKTFHTVGLGYLLSSESKNKSWTKQFLKFGFTASDAYEQWQALYNMSMVMCYLSFGIVCFKFWDLNLSENQYWPFKYIFGLSLIALQAWTSASILESLGEFGWFYGDFFHPLKAKKLTYSGIYRYLNNPEQLFGVSGLWGMSFLTNSFAVTLLALFWTISNLAFIQFVEHPHMKKIYGEQIRQEAGVTKTIRKAATKLPPPVEKKVRELTGSMDKVISETASAVEEFLKTKKPQKTVSNVVKETKIKLNEYPARLTIIANCDDVVDVDTSQYSLEVETPSISSDGLQFTIGSPLTVKWTAAPNHSAKDWIGLYKVFDNKSEEVSTVASRGHWNAVSKDSGFDDDHTNGIISVSEDGTSGEVVFKGNTLCWSEATYEFRYHHDGKHNVMARSQPFSIVSPVITITTKDDAETVAEKIFPVLKNCFEGSQTTLVPEDIYDEWDEEIERDVIRKMHYCLRKITGYELAEEVIRSEGCCFNLGRRLVRIKHVLEPFTNEV